VRALVPHLELERMAPDAPIRDWLRHTRYGTPPARVQAAFAAITAREAWASELACLMRDDDPEVAADAMRLVSQLPEPSAVLAPPVAEAGRDLATRLETVVKTASEQDPSYKGAADVAVRFQAWMQAALTLTGCCDGDFSAELRALLVLARQRPDSHVLRQDVVRVASYHLEQWTGEAPLPSDPPPR
jgi:hypothetical protein